jgi:hypothetical protein
MAIVLDTEMLSLVADVSNPYMKSINEALTAEYPDDADAAYTVDGISALRLAQRPQSVRPPAGRRSVQSSTGQI